MNKRLANKVYRAKMEGIMFRFMKNFTAVLATNLIFKTKEDKAELFEILKHDTMELVNEYLNLVQDTITIENAVYVDTDGFKNDINGKEM